MICRLGKRLGNWQIARNIYNTEFDFKEKDFQILVGYQPAARAR